MKRIHQSLLFILFFSFACQKPFNENRSWSVYKADAESTSYSPLDKINKKNVNELQLAWTFNRNDARGGSRFGSAECNPLIIDGVMYATSARHRLYAIDAG